MGGKGKGAANVMESWEWVRLGDILLAWGTEPQVGYPRPSTVQGQTWLWRQW